MQGAAENAAALAACPHVDHCGGCRDLGRKDHLLPAALRAAGFDPAAEIPQHVSPLGARRRMDLAARRTAGGVELGLHRHRSHDIVDLTECRVLRPELASLIAPLRAVLERLDLLRQRASVIANLADNGTDLLLRGDAPASRHDRTKLAAFAAAAGIARISHAVGNGPPETVALLRPPRVALGPGLVEPPPGAFLQATAQAEAAIRDAVLQGLQPAAARRRRIIELYAGCGTLTFALAEHAGVDAYEGDAAAIAALDRACRAACLHGRINPIHRDLTRQPLVAAELACAAALVLNPPASGAGAQMAQIAAGPERAMPPRVIYVSCNPETLARDARQLHHAGYLLLHATSIDQFIGTPLVEGVCVFGKG
jgi:23S rRNA (uracil1939-C5)-methyltransferase